jgi:hypothetical protein
MTQDVTPGSIPTPVQQIDVLPATTALPSAVNSAAAKAAWVRGYKAAHEDLGEEVPSEADAARAASGRIV